MLFGTLLMSHDCQVIGGSRVKDTKKKSMRRRSSSMRDKTGDGGSLDKPLHWVNLQILDHRWLLGEGASLIACHS